MKKALYLFFVSCIFYGTAFSQRIFWTQSDNRIRVGTLGETSITGATDFITGLNAPRTIEVDQYNGTLYYSNWGGEDIVAANLATGIHVSNVITTGAMAGFIDFKYSDNGGNVLFTPAAPEDDGVYRIPINNNDGNNQVRLNLGPFSGERFTAVAVDDDGEFIYLAHEDGNVYVTDFQQSFFQGVNTFGAITAMTVDDAGRLYLVNQSGPSSQIIRVDGGTSQVLYTIPSTNVYSIQVYHRIGKLYYSISSDGIYSGSMDGGTPATKLIDLPGSGNLFFDIEMDLTAPVLLSTAPVTGASNVSTSPALTMAFDENVFISDIAGAGNAITIRIVRTSDNFVHRTIDRSSPDISVVNNAVTISGTTGLDPNTNYHVLVGWNVFRDYPHNSFSGIGLSSQWNFTTVSGITVIPVTASACVDSFSSVPDIAVAEAHGSNFKTGTNVTIELGFSGTGYSFQPGAGSVDVIAGRNITSPSISITATTATVTYTVTGQTLSDALTISGLRISSTSSTNAPANIIRTGGTAMIDGIPVNTVLANISSIASPPSPLLDFPAGTTFCRDQDIASLSLVSATGVNLRWFHDADLTSEIVELSGASVATASNLQISTSSAPSSFLRYVTQTSGGCQSLAKEAVFLIHESPTIFVESSPNTACETPNGSAEATIVNPVGPLSEYEFTWYDGPDLGSPVIGSSTTSVLTGLPEGVYTLSVRHIPTGCPGIRSTEVLKDAVYPIINTPVAEVCEAAFESGTASLDLTTYDNEITGGNADLLVTWFEGGNPVSNVTASSGSSYLFVAKSTSSGCASEGSMSVTVYTRPTPSAAGSDQDVCGSSTTLEATMPIYGIGSWSVISGTGGSFASSSDHNTGFTGIAGNTYVLQWSTYHVAQCPESTSTISVSLTAPPSASNAGTPQTVCNGPVTLAANNPAVGTGEWSIVSGDGGIVTTPSAHNSSFSGTPGNTYVLQWMISNGSCLPSVSEVSITLSPSPTTAIGGPDVSTCEPLVTLEGSAPVTGTGQWSVVSGAGGIFSDASSPASKFSGASGTTYVLRWSIVSGACAPSEDDVTITFGIAPSEALAGSDRNICGNITTLNGNTPVSGTGAWSVVSGTDGSFGDAGAPSTTFAGIPGNTYTLRWTISGDVNCPSSQDDVLVVFTAPPSTAVAGADQSVCGASATLQASIPAVGTGQWSVVSGDGGVLASAGTASSSFSGPATSTHVLRWTVSNGICPPSEDDVTITFINPPTAAQAGPDQSVCASGVTLGANTPVSGTGTWSVVNGMGGIVSSPSGPSSNFVGIPGTTYTLRWTVAQNGCTSSTDDVTIQLKAVPHGTGVLSAIAPFCQGIQTTLTLTGVSNATTYNWNVPAGITILSRDGATAKIVAESGSGGPVSVTPSNECGNGPVTNGSLIILPRPDVTINIPGGPFPGNPVAFSFNTNMSVQEIDWSFGDGGISMLQVPEHSYEAAGDYTVTLTVRADNGCANTTTGLITVNEEPELGDTAIKNVITANGDEKNKYLHIVNIDRYPDNEVHFLDRWGIEVFSKSNYQNDWDARARNGDFLPAGQYICVVKLKATGKVFSRTVSIIKGR